MSIYKDVILIVDIEATCWENHVNPPGEVDEIIEVGICALNMERRELGDKRSLLVTPTQSTIGAFCTQLTTITPELIAREGMGFDAACAILEADYDSRNRLWASWGMYDHKMFNAQCKARDIRYPFSKKHANLKRVFADVYGERMGMTQALEKAGLQLEGTHHRGDDDAWNIGRLMAHILEKQPGAFKKYGV